MLIPGCMRRTRKGFTLVELLIVVGILGVLMTLVFPAVMRGRRRALRAACQNNLRQLHAMALMYAGDEKVFPFNSSLLSSATAADHLQLLVDYDPRDRPPPKLFVCPTAPEKEAAEDQTTKAYTLGDRSLSYAWINEEMTPDAGANRLLSADKSLENHGGEGINVVYFRADVEWIKAPGEETWEELTNNELIK